MATFSFGAQLYRAVSIAVLSLWATTALGFTALDVLNTNNNLVSPVASISLLTYLICRILVYTQGQNDSIAHLLTAPRRSRGEALAMLLFCGTWLYELVYKAMLMFFLTLFGGIMATAISNDNFESESGSESEFAAESFASDSDMAGSALAEIDQFKESAGVDPVEIFKRIPPKLLVYFAIIIWVNFGTMSLYVLRLSWRSVKVVLGTPPASNSVSEKQ
ncbi:hypothetical protein N7495_001317 [Penicillium taxi]|uniref:uncharacterized protein n=1 Tax=Penicillium taxi TaxID=168475 RepID=UPI0025458D8F|nr:uncharacterized protein N7495_001317 [Penicillium taxi]KAJ5908635.1 hypothetical protein N7495_001317 [Penicillium taxi]